MLDSFLIAGLIAARSHERLSLLALNSREESFLTDKAIGIISGFGISSYSLALEGIIGYLN